MMPYILHVTAITTVCFIFYKLLLQKQTFYRLNRWMLMGCIGLSFCLPLLSVPKEWSWRDSYPALVQAWKTKVQETPSTAVKEGVPMIPEQSVAEKSPESAVVPGAQALPVREKAKVTPVGLAPAKKEQPAVVSVLPAAGVSSAAGGAVHATATGSSLTSRIMQWLFYCYLFGVFVLAVNFLFQMAVLLYQSYAAPVIRDGRFRIVETSGNRAPCSFGNTIFINPSNYDWDTYNQILLHEKTHVNGRHTMDILLAEAAVILQWFNPFVWMYRKEVETNLEFLTDAAVLGYEEIDASEYQLSLLRVAAPHLPFSLTTNYNQSLLKKRIVMINSKRSSRHTVWKYFFLLPLLTGLVCALNKPVVSAQDVAAKPKTIVKNVVAAKPVAAPLPPTPSMATPMPPMPGLASPSLSPAPIPPIKLAPLPAIKGPGFSEGAWFLTTHGDKLDFTLKQDTDGHNWQSSFTVDKNELSPFPGQGTVSFKITREAGTIAFTGQFDGKEGFGHFVFTEDAAYTSDMKAMGIDLKTDQLGGTYFLLNITREYAKMVRENGFSHVTSQELISLSALRIDKEYVQYWRGYYGTDKITPEELIGLKALHIDKAYVEDLKAAGYDNLATGQLSSLKALHIDGNYIRSTEKAQGHALSVESLISYKAQGIDDKYVASLRDAGYDHLSSDNLVTLHSMGVTAYYIRNWKEAGYDKLTVNELITLKSIGVSPEFGKGFEAIGYSKLAAEQLVTLKSLGVTPEFAKEFKQIGFDNIPVNMLTSLKATGVDAAYVSKMKAKGLDTKDLNKYISLKSSFN